MIKIEHCDYIDFLGGIPQNSVDLIFTDPPYWTLNMHRNVGTTTRLKKQWFDTISCADMYELLKKCYEVLKPNRHCLMMCDGQSVGEILGCADEIFDYAKPLVWDKVVPGMGYHLRCQHEFIVLMDKGKNRIPKDRSVSDIIRMKRVMRPEYPTQKPVELVELFLNLYTEPGELVVDPFLGSGTTAIACKKLGRNFCGCDVSEEAVQLSGRRLALIKGND